MSIFPLLLFASSFLPNQTQEEEEEKKTIVFTKRAQYCGGERVEERQRGRERERNRTRLTARFFYIYFIKTTTHRGHRHQSSVWFPHKHIPIQPKC